MRFASLFFCAGLLAHWPVWALAAGDPVADAVASVQADTITAYKWFHQHPELSEQEKGTAAYFANELRELGLEVHEGIGGHGVVGLLRSDKGADKQTVLYRTDMDALPVLEKTGVPWASKNEGVMHACGHDVHMATALGVIAVMKRLSSQWQGTIMIIGQPAEEIGLGAYAMLDDPKFKRIRQALKKPKLAVAIHDWSDIPAGSVGIGEGHAFANVNSLDIEVFGRGGHAARPNETVDPIVIGAEIVMALQTIVSRRIDPTEPAVITVGKFTAGTKRNVISSTATLLLTVRSYSDETRDFLLREIRRVGDNVAKAHGAPRTPKYNILERGLPAAYNDPTWTRKLRKLFIAHLGQDNVYEVKPPMTGEDFGLFPRVFKIPGVIWRVGGANRATWQRTQGIGMPGLHSETWLPETKPTLFTGVDTVTRSLLFSLQ